MEQSKIEWTTHTFNPWIGCDKVAPECANCYAEALMDKRYGRVQWGKGNPRQRTSENYWKQPLKWNREAEKSGDRPRVFCASLADWLDDEVPIGWLADLLLLIDKTPNLDWLLLSKRVEDWCDRLEAVNVQATAKAITQTWISGDAPPNVWVGASAGCQQTADRMVPALAEIPANIRFLSCEPLLGAIRFERLPLDKIHWAIVGGESGKGARLCDAAWMRILRDQCSDNNVAFFVKQLGENFRDGDYPELDYSHVKGKGGELSVFPSDLQKRQFPKAAIATPPTWQAS